MRIWLDLIFCQELKRVADWSKIDKEDYLLAMERSPIRDIEIKYLQKSCQCADIYSKNAISEQRPLLWNRHGKEVYII